MYDELTEVDIKKMEEEIHYRECVLGPELLAEMKRTREFGDLSENAEYKEAKREKRKNEGRIRYLKNMIETRKKQIKRSKRKGEIMSFSEREGAILDYLRQHKEATVSELCRILYVSEPTMRRDLYALSRYLNVCRKKA